MRIFWEKTVQIVKKTVKIVCLRLLGAPPPDLRIFIPAYYNSVGGLSSAKCILFRSKKKQVTPANILSLLLLYFCTYFLIQTL